MVTDIDRIIGCTWRMHTKGQISQTSFASRFGTDLPLYCFTIIVITLWMQWHYLYKIMENFEEALRLLEKKTQPLSFTSWGIFNEIHQNILF